MKIKKKGMEENIKKQVGEINWASDFSFWSQNLKNKLMILISNE